MATAKFKHTGDSPIIYSDLKRPDGRTVEAEPGEEFEVGAVLHPLAVLHELLQALNTEAKKLVTDAKKAAKEVVEEVEHVAEVVEADLGHVEASAHDATVTVDEPPAE